MANLKAVELLALLEAGKLENLLCPQCQRESVSVWFTHPAPEEYRTWLICSTCEFQARAHNSSKPAHYSEAKRHIVLETKDGDILDRAIFRPAR